MDAIGQSFNYYTTLQMANYAATIANGGRLHNLTLLDLVTSANFANIVFENTPSVRTDSTSEYGGFLEIVRQGMRLSATEGTGASLFADYPIEVATKTGTTQSDATTTNSGVFICFAPYDNPEIAIAVTVENGKSGSTIMAVAKEMLDYYFSDSFNESYLYENELLP
jgi:penicillin-binding protein 2